MRRRHLSKDFQLRFWADRTNQRRYDHPVVARFAEQRMAFLKSQVDFGEIASAFDVGCGDGFGTHPLSLEVPHVEAGDSSPAMLEQNPLPDDRLRVIDAEDLDLPDDSYDLVQCWELLHHLPDPEGAVREMARVSRRHVVAFEPNRANLALFAFGLLVRSERGVLRSSKRFLERSFEAAGLQDVKSFYCGRILPNRTPAFLARLLARLPFRARRFTGISILVIGTKGS